jgi:carboxymethylenebutenolidase
MAEKPLGEAKDFHPETLRLFDRYVHGAIDRRVFLDAAARYAAAGATAVELLEALQPRFAFAQKVAPADPRLRSEWIEIESPAGYGKAHGYLVRPAQAPGKTAMVLVAHENRGLNPHIEDIARRLALAGFIAFAPDALFPLGRYPGDEDEARALFSTLDQAKTREDFIAAARFLKALPDGSGALGAIGFCYGGGIVNFLATRLPDLRAAVAYYGPAPELEKAAAIEAELLLHFAEHDERVNAGWPAYEAALKKAGTRYSAYVYPGVWHGFNNDTTPRYDAAAAKLSFERTIAFFDRTLRG